MKVNTPFSIMAFPMGPVCNLACDYCYYLHKTALYPDQPDFTMEEALLEEYTRQYLAAHPGTPRQLWLAGRVNLPCAALPSFAGQWNCRRSINQLVGPSPTRSKRMESCSMTSGAHF